MQHIIDTIGSGFTAQQRLDIISENVANMNTAHTENRESPSDFKDPCDPDANEDGYVDLPNVNLVKEITDSMVASQAYPANVTVFNLFKSVISEALKIGNWVSSLG